MADRAQLLADYRSVRDATTALCEPLEPEDFVVQSMDDASPVKWHLAHTTWFFETFVLARAAPDYRPFDDQWGYLFNSYYQTVGAMHPRPRRGMLSRPTTPEIRAYRRHVDERVRVLLAGCDDDTARRVTLGLHHEQQHQELLLMDLEHHFWCNPLRPAYARAGDDAPGGIPALGWVELPGGLHEVGHDGDGFAFDNETPRHAVYLRPYRLATRPVTCGEWLAFVADGGYDTPSLWLADGWAAVRGHRWRAPLYWEQTDGRWEQFTLMGMRALDPAAPVAHLSLYEADAYARWAGARLPTEHEWEVAARAVPVAGNLLDTGRLRPRPAVAEDGDGATPNRLTQLWGDVWEWTASPYASYPGFRPLAGSLGEYNGKFMCNQLVLRGGSCLTPRSHIRASYRNFFYPHQRWNTQGVRLARDG